MSLTGMQIFKYLPAAKKTQDTNCKACGCPTCMAYALKLAKQQADIEKCPHVPQELKEKFAESSKIQQHVIKLSETLVTGGETVMHRHDKTFVNRTVIAIELDADDRDFEKKLKRITDFQIERIGETFKVDAIYLTGGQNACDESPSANCRNSSAQCRVSPPRAKAAALIDNAGMAVIDENGGLYGTPDEYAIVRGNTLKELEEASKRALESGVKRLLLEPSYFDNGVSPSQKPFAVLAQELVQIRKSAIIDRYEPFTHPVIVRMPENSDLTQVCAQASAMICKYANVIVLKEFDEALVSTLFTLRQNIYTNPQKPLQVEAKVYEFNEPDENSPILLTTNFALTYFAVAGELESLPFGSYLVVTPSDGMSVLTAWSADKFTAELVARSVKDYGLLEKVKTRKIIIPGLLSHMREELQDAMPEWQIITGTIEAYRIPEFLKTTQD